MALDYTALSELTRDLGAVSSPLVIENAQKALEVTARRVKDAWNGKLYRDGHAKKTGRSISYDVGVARQFALWQTDALTGPDAASLVAEIGPKRGPARSRGMNADGTATEATGGRQAGVVRLLENGSAHNAPHGYGAAALQENEADFERGLDLAVQSVEKAAGL